MKPPTCSDEAVDPPTSRIMEDDISMFIEMTVRWEFMIAFRVRSAAWKK